MSSTSSDSLKGGSSAFSEFIRNAKPDEKERVYREVLIEATKQQNLVLKQAQDKRA